MKKTLDVKTLECPKPVIETQKALKEAAITQLEVLVGNQTAKENIKRFAESGGYEYTIEDKGGDVYSITIDKESWNEEEQESKPAAPVVTMDGGNTYLILGEKLGKGEGELGKLLMKSFLYTLTQTQPFPKKIILLNSAIRLSTENVETVEHLQMLSKNGTQIYNCGTCLNFYQLTQELKVGEIGNMYDVVESIQNNPGTIVIG